MKVAPSPYRVRRICQRVRDPVVQLATAVDALASQHVDPLTELAQVAKDAFIEEVGEVRRCHELLEIVGDPGGHERRNDGARRGPRHPTEFVLFGERLDRPGESGALDAATLQHQISRVHANPRCSYSSCGWEELCSPRLIRVLWCRSAGPERVTQPGTSRRS